MDIDDVEHVAVLGAGSMGHGIAEVAAIAGYSVTLRDIAEDVVQEGYETIEWSLGKLVEGDRLGRAEADAALERVTPVLDVDEAVGSADVVLEAVPERMDVKREVWSEVDRAAAESAVFATNTSSLSITDLGEAAGRPQRFCGMHFFNPPVRMALVEVIAGEKTAEETLTLVESLAESMGKTPVRVRKDSPGFVVNRVLVPMLNEAAWLVDEGEATIDEVDSTARFGLDLPMGAFELADRVGVDVVVDILEYMNDRLGEAYAPCPLLVDTVEAGATGEKAGRGFYDHEDDGPEVPDDAQRERVGRLLVAIMANEVAKLVADDVADPETIDEAVQLGAGFPAGPARMADDVGLGRLRDLLVERHEATGAARYAPAELLSEFADEGRDYRARADGGTDRPEDRFETIRVEREGAVRHVVIDRPDRLNSITPVLLGELDAAIDDLEAAEDVRAVLLTGAGDRAFSTGADADVFADGIGPTEAESLSRRGQAVFGRLEAMDCPVVAGVDGYCLGGGMELATACDLRVASERSTFGQPEHDLGILPGWGGTQRLPRIVGEARAKEVVLTADRYDAETMYEYGYLNRVVGHDELATAAMALASELAAGPPMAQAYTKHVMHAGRDDIDAGLAAEAKAFGLAFATEDFVEGVTAFADDAEPEFEGR